MLRRKMWRNGDAWQDLPVSLEVKSSQIKTYAPTMPWLFHGLSGARIGDGGLETGIVERSRPERAYQIGRRTL